MPPCITRHRICGCSTAHRIHSMSSFAIDRIRRRRTSTFTRNRPAEFEQEARRSGAAHLLISCSTAGSSGCLDSFQDCRHDPVASRGLKRKGGPTLDAGEKLGGVGPGVSPKKAMCVGLKDVVNAWPDPVFDALKSGLVDIDGPNQTLA